MSFFDMLFSWTGLCTILLMFVGVLLMFIVLLQRGRGGGLAGAFGGLGGQSAFGTKAGDVFTKITVVLATVWVLLAGVTGFAMRYDAARNFKEAEKGNPTKIQDKQKEDSEPSTGPVRKKDDEKDANKKKPDPNNKDESDKKIESDKKSKTDEKTKPNKKPATPPKEEKEKKDPATKDKTSKDPKKTKKD